MTRAWFLESMEASTLSRASGNESSSKSWIWLSLRSVPREWEWIVGFWTSRERNWVCPTRVGMNRIGDRIREFREGLSHASGNESSMRRWDMDHNESVPREWEWVGRQQLCWNSTCGHSTRWEWIVPTGIILGKDKACPTHVGMSRRLKKTVWCILLPYTLVEVNCTMIN